MSSKLDRTLEFPDASLGDISLDDAALDATNGGFLPVLGAAALYYGGVIGGSGLMMGMAMNPGGPSLAGVLFHYGRDFVSWADRQLTPPSMRDQQPAPAQQPDPNQVRVPQSVENNTLETPSYASGEQQQQQVYAGYQPSSYEEPSLNVASNDAPMDYSEG